MQAESKRLKILVAVDGADHACVTARHAVALAHAGLNAQWHLINIQPALESGHARMFVGADELQSWYREEGLAALAGAVGVFAEGAVEVERHVVVGHAAETILTFVSEHGFDQLIVGAGSSGALSGLLLGSVAGAVLRSCPVPTTVVR